MTRSGLRLPPSIEARLHYRGVLPAIRRTADAAGATLAGAPAAGPARVAVPDMAEARDPADGGELLERFEDHYQDLVDLLCWSAKDGVHDGRDARYARLRAWFLVHYDVLRPFVLPYLDEQPDDRVALEQGQPTPRDAFEALFTPCSVDAIINSPDVISRIQRTRNALDAYYAELLPPADGE